MSGNSWLKRCIWYRPPSLSALGRLTSGQVQGQGRAYVCWLATERRWRSDQAEAYARAQAKRDESATTAAVEANTPAIFENWKGFGP